MKTSMKQLIALIIWYINLLVLIFAECYMPAVWIILLVFWYKEWKSKALHQLKSLSQESMLSTVYLRQELGYKNLPVEFIF